MVPQHLAVCCGKEHRKQSGKLSLLSIHSNLPNLYLERLCELRLELRRRDTLFVLWFILFTIKMVDFAALGVDLQFGLPLWLLPVTSIGHWIGLYAHRICGRLIASVLSGDWRSVVNK